MTSPPYQLKAASETVIRTLAGEGDYSPLIARLLASRGITSAEAAEAFMYAELDDLYPADALDGMPLAAELLTEAVEKGQKILVHGDYDADGVTSTALLTLFLRELGAQVGHYIPHRVDEGYGLSAEGIEWAAEQGYEVLVSVDCGSSSPSEVERARALGITTIITDHHRVGEVQPAADAFVNPCAAGSSYPFAGLSGVGVAYKLARAVSERLDRGNADGLLDLVAIGTIGDVVPLVSENRILVRAGLELINSRPRVGLQALLELRGKKNDPGTRITSTTIGFQVAPVINACGRLDHANLALELLIEQDPARAAALAHEADQLNERRKEMSRSLQDAALSAATQRQPRPTHVVVEASRDWHQGLVGIAASKVKERLNLPALLLSVGEEGLAKGSGRSPENVDLYECLKQCADLVERFGGHPRAAGFTVREDRIDALRERLDEVIGAHAGPASPALEVDSILPLAAASDELIEELELLQPFGRHNEIPQFALKDVSICQVQRQSHDGSTLKLLAQQGPTSLECVGFALGALATQLRDDQPYTLIGALERNYFKHNAKLQLRLTHIINSEGQLVEPDLEPQPQPQPEVEAEHRAQPQPQPQAQHEHLPQAEHEPRPQPPLQPQPNFELIDLREERERGHYLVGLLKHGDPVVVIVTRGEEAQVKRLASGPAPHPPQNLTVIAFHEVLSQPSSAASHWVLFAPPPDQQALRQVLRVCQGRCYLLFGADELTEQEVLIRTVSLDRPKAVEIYRTLMASASKQPGGARFGRDILARVASALSNPLITPRTVRVMVKILTEIGVLREDPPETWTVTGTHGRLDDSPTYQRYLGLLEAFSDIRRIFSADPAALTSLLRDIRDS
jgi:single-stranded-DNA-specific exonuclease